MRKNKPDARSLDTVNKLMLSKKLSENNTVSKPKAKIVMQAVIDCMIALLTDGQSVNIKNCGVLSVHQKSERPGRNPKTGEPHIVTARKVINFGVIPGNKNKASIPKICSIISTLAHVNYQTAKLALDIFTSYVLSVKDGLWRMELRGLGVFYYSVKPKGGIVRNPNTGEKTILTCDRTHLKFKASGLLLKSINNK